jgi:hypothetical protein
LPIGCGRPRHRITRRLGKAQPNATRELGEIVPAAISARLAALLVAHESCG